MRIIGIDPGSVITGIGIVDCSSDRMTLVDADTVLLNKTHNINYRLKIIYDEILRKINLFKPELFAIETAFYGKNIQSTLKLGQARGVAIIAALNCGLEIFEYAPREIKRSLTGNGASSKEQVLFMVKRILNINREFEYIDSSDALAAAICHFHNLSSLTSINVGKISTKAGLRSGWTKFAAVNPTKLL
ncbi:crossover junction endodeoxyribonuclease RuvC [soil metagenome]